ncbi:DNA polymerase III polC-type (PolIII) [Alteracholeplasma palmae J233]|uniref:DNA polymerase III PolC-type n=1 Tax=Alteracholeplasma palmae (strain ATCC 49389 / J233) TaxID=1318466 RepID=U4KK31_ALTPJ|nr:PolC-type DNA polymerase III [Alteracholeplasma palmae]CCV63979.1 DNA polymerase III polC-type (PolIII) [Alteracholeplasma palmae J233]
MEQNKNKFNLFLEQSRFSNDVLKNALLEYVEVDRKEKKWSFHILLDEVISPHEITILINQLQSFFTIPRKVLSVDFKLTFKNKDLKTYSKEYYEYIIGKVAAEKPSLLIFKNFESVYEKSIYKITVDKDSKQVERYFKELEKAFLKYGIETKFELVINEKLETASEQIEKAKLEHEELVKKQQTFVEKVVTEKVQFTRNSSPSAVSITEIPATQYDLDKYQNEKGDTNFLIEGEVLSKEQRQLTNTTLLTLSVADKNDAIVIKQFLRKPKDFELSDSIKTGDMIQISGRAVYDTYQSDVVIIANSIYSLERKEKEVRVDKARQKRIEFHVHTKMSNMDAIASASDYIALAESWGHEAIAITDHNGVYAYPEIASAVKGKNIKPIYGVELDFVDENDFKITNKVENDFLLKDATYVVFDIETTGLSSARDKIIEIAGVKVQAGAITETYQTFINPEQELSEFTKNLTNITDEMVLTARTIDEVLPEFIEFTKGSVLVAHNALFDIGHIYEKSRQLNITLEDYPIIDTLGIARYFYHEELKRFNLKALTKYFKVKLESHHRADDDAKATAHVFLAMLNDLMNKNISNFSQINEAIAIEDAWKHQRPYHINVLAKNQVGYKNIFKIVSDSLTNHFYKGPRTLKSVLTKYREGILVGSSCANGDVFEAALNLSDQELEEKIGFYDYIEVQPPIAYKHLMHDIGENGPEIINEVIKKIIFKAKEQNKIVIASSDAHYLNPEDRVYREIYIRTKLVGGGIHSLARYDVLPDNYLLTTHEMLEQFAFLGADLCEEIVIRNTHLLNEKIETIQAFPKDLYSLKDDAFKDSLGVESITEEMKRLIYDKVSAMYGANPHEIVTARLKKELKSIIDNGFAPIYYISHLLVKKSLEDGYLVGSRGSVGSSFVATMLDITEVNPLSPHYRCPKCQFTIFKMTDEEVTEHGIKDADRPFLEKLQKVNSGYDLPDMKCPCCEENLAKDGHDIPFETFLGFKGDKVPDIDLNFAGDYQSKAHSYVRELLGEDYTFRAGTIQTVAEKNAYGYVKGYLEDKNIYARTAQIARLAKGIEGVKRSTGQHPGGIVVVPKDHTIYDVTPIQYPADDTNSEWKTTHFDYHSFESNLLKLDILGHDDPMLIKFLMDYVKEHPDEFPFKKAQDIPLDDQKVYQLFAGTQIIGVTPEEIQSEIASYAIPEFGTPFTRQMLKDTKPTTFAGLVKISGLAHGTDVWLKNAQDLVLGTTDHGKIDFEDIIGCRDDIMVQLMEFGLEPAKAFEIMEFVRKGKPSKDPKKWAVYEQEMRKSDVPEWYIWSAGKIKYMFPKAHATAYVIMAMRIAWFKIHKPLLFYSGFFSKRASQFDYDVMTSGYNAIRNKLVEYSKESSFNLKVKDENLIVTLGVALEMTKRGFKFLPLDIDKSLATTFKMEEDGLRMPFTSIDGLGEAVAIDIEEKRNQKPFTSKKDIKSRTRINKTIFEKMESSGVFEHLEEESEALDQGLFADFS